MSKKRIIRKSIAGVLALTMMVPTVLPSGEFVMDVLDSGIMRVAAEEKQEESKIGNNRCPWFDMDYNSNYSNDKINFNLDFQATAKSVDVMTCNEKDGEYSKVGDPITVDSSISTLNVPILVGINVWYKFIVTFDDETVEETQPIMFMSGGYITNGSTCYKIVETDSGYSFDFKGWNEDKWVQTSYSNLWGLGTSSSATPQACKYNSCIAKIKSLKFGFELENPYSIEVSALLNDTEKSFTFGTDVQIGTYDAAPVTAVRDEDGNIVQIQMVGTNGLLEDIEPGMDSMVISTPYIQPSNYWIGYYSERVHNSYNNTVYTDNYKYYNSEKVETLLDNSGHVYQVQGMDSGLTVSWGNINPGEEIKFYLKVGSVEHTGASNRAIVSTGIAKSSTEIEVLDGTPENYYKLSIVDGDTTQDIKLKYDEGTGSYYPSDDGEVWITPEEEGDFVISRLIPETNYILSVVSKEDKALMDAGSNEVVPETCGVNTFIDPYESINKDEPVKWTVTGSIIKVENLRDGYKYALKNCTDFVEPVNGTIVFDNLDGATDYELIAKSLSNDKFNSDTISIRTKIDVHFVDERNNYDKTFVLEEGGKLSESDLNDVNDYISSNGNELQSMDGWYSSESLLKLEKDIEYLENVTYSPFVLYNLSKLNNEEDSNMYLSVDTNASDIINDTEDTRDVVIYGGYQEYSFSVEPEQCLTEVMNSAQFFEKIDDFDGKLVYLDQIDGVDYFAVPISLDQALVDKDSKLFTELRYYIPEELTSLVEQGKVGLIVDIESGIECSLYGIDDYCFAYVSDYDCVSKSILENNNNWAFVDNTENATITGSDLPFDILFSMKMYQYFENGEIVRSSNGFMYEESALTWLRVDDLYDGKELILGNCNALMFFDEHEDLIRTIGVKTGDTIPADAFEELNDIYSDNPKFCGWYSYYGYTELNKDTKIEASDMYFPLIGVTVSELNDMTPGDIIKEEEYVRFFNNTDQEVHLWVDGCEDLLYSYSSSWVYFDYIDDYPDLCYVGNKDNNYYLTTLYPNSYLEKNEYIASNAEGKYLYTGNNCDYNLFGIGNSYIVDYLDSDMPSDYYELCDNIKSKTWSFKKTFSGSGIISGANLPFDGICTENQTCIISNNKSVQQSGSESVENNSGEFEAQVIHFGKDTPEPIIFRKVKAGLDFSQIEGIISITVDGVTYDDPSCLDGIIEISQGRNIVILARESIDSDLKGIEEDLDTEYKYTINVGEIDPDKTYYAYHKHSFEYSTGRAGGEDSATLKYRCDSEINAEEKTLATLGIKQVLYYGDSLDPKLELIPENLVLGMKMEKGSVLYKSGDNISSKIPTSFGIYNVSAEVKIRNLNNSITSYYLSKNVSYEKRSLSECNVIVSSVTYDGTAKIPTVKVINPSNGEELKLNTDYTIEPITKQTAVGTYNDGIKLHAVETSENYTGDRSVSWSINKADLPGFSINALDKYTYGSALTIGVNELPEDALDGKVTYKYSVDKVNWDDAIPKDSGVYYVKALFTESASYNDTETAPFKFTIEKKKILITPVAAEMTYGDIMPLITCTLSDTVDEKPEPTQEQLAELVTVKGFSEDGSVRNTSNNAGKYQIVLSNKAKNPELKNYVFTFDNSNPVYLTVKPREISADMFRLYSEDFIGDEYHFEYDGTRKNVSYYVNTSDTDGNYYVEDTYAVLKPDDFEQGGTVYATKAGAYKVEFIGNNELYGKGNWCGFKTLEWNISARDINVKIQAANGAEADKEYDGTPVAFEIVSTDPEKTLSSKAKVVYKYYKQNGTDTPDLLDAAPSDAGSYRVEAEVTEENSNVKVTGTDYVIRPKAATVNIDASTATKVYGDKTPEIKYTFEGIAASDEAEYAANTSGNVTADLTSENAGTYDLVADFADSNYSFTLSQTSFEVTPREIVEADVAISSSKVYIPDSGWTNPIVTVTSNGNTLTENTDYVLSGTFKTRIKGDKSFLVEGTGNYKGEVEVNWTAIAASDLSIMMTSAEPVYADGNYKVKYNFTMPELPEGLTAVKYGALYSKDGALDENASINSGASKTEKKAERPDTYSLTINNKEKMENKTSAKCYLIVKDKEDHEFEIYSDTATYSYRDASLGCCGNITAEENTIVKENGQYKIVYTFDLNVPEGFTVKEYGALYNKDGIIASDLTYETAANKTTSSGNADLNRYTLKINEKDNPDKVSSARCYARVTDGKNEYMIYSNVVSDSFRSAAQREAEKNCSMKCDVSKEVKALTVTNPYKAIFKYTLNAGEGYTVISRGALYDKTVKLADHTTLESNASRVEKDGSGTYTLTMGYDAPEKAKGSAIGFMKVVDSYGLEHIIYSENQSCLSFTEN